MKSTYIEYGDTKMEIEIPDSARILVLPECFVKPGFHLFRK